jgi:hypothetical protein
LTGLLGDLGLFHPVDIFQFLGFVRARGMLVMTRGAESARLFFDEGRITGAAAPTERPPLGSILCGAGLLTEEQLEAGLETSIRLRRRLGETLVEDGVITSDTLETALEDQLSRTVHGLLRWREGIFQFDPGVPAGEQQISARTPLDRMLFEGLKRMDEEAEEVRKAAQ